MPLNHVHFGLPLGKFTQMSDYVNPEATDDGCPFWKKSRFSFVPPTVNFCSSRHGEVPEQDANIRKKLLWCSSSLFPKIVKRMLVDNGFSIVPASEPWLGYWGHRHKVSEFVALMPYQKVNHFPGNFLLGRKDRLSSNIDQMAKRWKKQEFTFVPETYILPSQRRALLARMKRRASQCDVFIMKPPSSSRGNGIRLINKARNVPEQKPLIVQRYITNPYLINGFKFDLRLYVLVSSWKPLRAYLYEEGIVRFASCNPTPHVSGAGTVGEKYASSSKVNTVLSGPPEVPLDESKPAANIQVRFPDGSRLQLRMNLHRTCFHFSKKPEYCTRAFVLLAGFPAKEITNIQETIEEAHLANCAIMVRPIAE